MYGYHEHPHVSFLVFPVIIGKCLISVTEFLLAYLLGKSDIEDINSQSRNNQGLFILIIIFSPFLCPLPPCLPLRPSLDTQAVSGISGPLQEPAGSAFASEPAGV